MTDLEMTRLCAEAMGYDITGTHHGGLPLWAFGVGLYQPIADDEQAMALVKRFVLPVWPLVDGTTHDGWVVGRIDSGAVNASSKDLNRAIVECVAAMQVDRTAREAAATSKAE